MKIGILTYHRAKNYGAYLQAYGLCSRLNEEKDITAEIIDFHMKKEVSAYKIDTSVKFRILHFKKYFFLKKLHKTLENSLKYLPLSQEYCCSDDVEDLRKLVQGKYDVIIVGSDEVWKTDGIRSFPNPYWLEGDMGCDKMSYAASSRSDLTSMSPDQRNKIRRYLNDFSCISVRDQMTQKQLAEVMGSEKEIFIHPDPSFFCHYSVDKEKGRQLLKEKGIFDLRKKIAVVMTENDEVAEVIRKEFADEYLLVSVFHWHKTYINIPELSPFDWLKVLACSDFLFTSYFHATCFAIVYNIQFLAFGTKIKSSKLLDVLSASGNDDRFVMVEDELFRDGVLREKFDAVERVRDSQEFCQYCQGKFEEFLRGLYENCKKRKI